MSSLRMKFPKKPEDWLHTAANYAMGTASAVVSNPAGEWNHARVVVNKGHVEHWLNTEKVVKYELWTDEWKEMAEKWKNAPGYALPKKDTSILGSWK